jgi:ferredoxin/flavodoxin---NADP+ reductase
MPSDDSQAGTAAATIAAKFHTVRIERRRDLTDVLWIVHVACDTELRFNAGQYATLGVLTPEGRMIERPYSIVSSPYERELEFVLELVPHGELTPRLYELHPGDTLFMRKTAKGRFTLDRTSGRTSHLLLSTITGIAPFVSYVRTLHADWKEGRFAGDARLFLLQGASYSIELAYRDEMERLASEVPWLTYVPTISRPHGDERWTGETGRVDDVIRKYTDKWALDPAQSVAYLCGHPEMVEHGKAILERCRWPRASLKEEAYFVPAD